MTTEQQEHRKSKFSKINISPTQDLIIHEDQVEYDGESDSFVIKGDLSHKVIDPYPDGKEIDSSVTKSPKQNIYVLPLHKDIEVEYTNSIELAGKMETYPNDNK